MTKQTIKRIINFSAFIAVLAATILVLVGKLVPSIQDILFMIAGILCFVVCVFAGGFYAVSKRNGVYIALLIVSVGIAIVAIIL
jgi:hypothetical protein